MILFVVSIFVALAGLIVWLISKKGAVGVAAIVVAAALLVLSCVTTVPTGHTGVVTTFGRVENYTLDAGVHMVKPWQQVVKMDNRVQKQTVTLACFSSDIQEVNVSYTVNYQIRKADAMTLYSTVGTGYYDTVIAPNIAESVKVATARYTAEALRQMLIRRIIALASMHPEHRFVLFIDEVSFMQEDEFYWLVDVCNALIRGHVVLTVFLVGMDESLNLFELFKNFDQMQVVNRFMRTQIEFPGIKGFKGLQDTLNSFDSSFVFKDSNVVLFREFFPEMYREGGSLVDCSQDILDAFNEACAEISSPIAEISMGVLTQAIVDCCCTYGKYGKGLIRPGFKEWKDCISLSLGNSPMIM